MCWPRVGEANPLFSVYSTLCRWTATSNFINAVKRQRNLGLDGHKKNNKRKNNDLQYTTQKTKNRVTRTPLKTNNDLQNTTQKTKDRATRTPLKTNNDLQNTTQKTKDRATRTSLKTNNDLQNTTQKTKDRATRTSLKQTMIYKTMANRKVQTTMYKTLHRKQRSSNTNQKLIIRGGSKGGRGGAP